MWMPHCACALMRIQQAMLALSNFLFLTKPPSKNDCKVNRDVSVGCNNIEKFAILANVSCYSFFCFAQFFIKFANIEICVRKDRRMEKRGDLRRVYSLVLSLLTTVG